MSSQDVVLYPACALLSSHSSLDDPLFFEVFGQKRPQTVAGSARTHNPDRNERRLCRNELAHLSPSELCINACGSGHPDNIQHLRVMYLGPIHTLSPVGGATPNYCILSQNGNWYAWKLGPGGTIKVDNVAANACK